MKKVVSIYDKMTVQQLLEVDKRESDAKVSESLFKSQELRKRTEEILKKNNP